MIEDCWNKIGVRGDGTCPELKRHAHCRNCPVYGAAAAELLHAAPADEALSDRTHHFAKPKHIEEGCSQSILIFRLDTEWLAVPTSIVDEVATPKPIHSLPGRRNHTVLGLTNVRGELLMSVSLALILNLPTSPESTRAGTPTSYARLLVLRRDSARVVCPVDEVYGIHRFSPSALRDVPATLARAGSRYSTKLLPWDGRSVGILDDQLLFYAVRRSVA